MQSHHNYPLYYASHALTKVSGSLGSVPLAECDFYYKFVIKYLIILVCTLTRFVFSMDKQYFWNINKNNSYGFVLFMSARNLTEI